MGEQRRIFPILMSGGAGTRLWPLSREDHPKQMHRLSGDLTLLQQTAARVLDPDQFAPLTVIGSATHRSMIDGQLREMIAGVETIVLEPAPRNTAAAAAVAALLVSRAQADGLLLLMPADHLIDDADKFRATVSAARDAAAAGFITLFGIEPDAPATGYGYIDCGEPIPGAGPARRVNAFVEKPDRAKAEEYLGRGGYLWNSGIFLMSAATLIAEFEKLEPDLLDHARKALDAASRNDAFLTLDQECFERCRTISLDHAIMERTERAAVVPADFSWTDIGSWSALWDVTKRDAAGNAISGDVLTEATRNSFIRSEGPLVALIGVEDLIVVATPDAVLIAHKDSDQDVKEIVKRLQDAGRDLV